MARIRIGLIGLDHWYSAIPLALSLRDRSDAELVAIADRDLERARSVAERAGVERVTTDPEDILNDPSIDAIFSFVSVDRNPEVCVQAAENGKHILSIKPFARSLDEGTQIVGAVRQAGVIFLPAESRGRLSPAAQQLRGWIEEGKLGKVLTAGFSMWAGLPQGWESDDDPGWFVDKARAPGGGWIDHSIYHIDLMRWLLDCNVSEVVGVAANLKYEGLPVEDYGTATLTFYDGTIATMEDTWLAPEGGFRASMNIVGSESAVVQGSILGAMALAGLLSSSDGWTQVASEPTFAEGLDHFLACIRGEAQPIATVEDAWHNLATCRAFYDSSNNGCAVKVQIPRPA